MKKILYPAMAIALLLTSCSSSDKGEEEWQRIFNGKNLEGWTIKISAYPLNENYNNTFRVEDGKMVASYENYESFNGEFGHIFYHEKLSLSRLFLLPSSFHGPSRPSGPEKHPY